MSVKMEVQFEYRMQVETSGSVIEIRLPDSMTKEEARDAVESFHKRNGFWMSECDPSHYANDSGDHFIPMDRVRSVILVFVEVSPLHQT
jgi:hypothetical protein